MTCRQICVQVVKGRHRFAFVYPEGCESQVLAALVDLACDPGSEFDWLDAALLSFQLGRQPHPALESVA